MKKRVTIQDVAAESGVSITTISRYLNGRYEAMSESTRQRIQDVIREMGYRPNALAQGLKGNKSRMVAAIVVNMGYPFCVGFIRSLNQVLSPAGYNLFVSETGGDPVRERDIIRSLQAQQVDAMVLQTGGQNNDVLAEIAKSIPVVLVDREFEVENATNVLTDNFAASRELTSHLASCGYRTIQYVTEAEEGIRTRADRLRGYLVTCEELGIKPHIHVVQRGNVSTFERVSVEVQKQVALGSTAVYTANGLLMMELYPFLSALGYHVPDELGLATYDDPDWATLVDPSLTCVRQPIDEMGEYTGSVLLREMENRAELTGDSQRIELPSTLVPRKSTILLKRCTK